MSPVNRETVIGLLLIVAVTVLVYGYSLRGGFLLDDDLLLTDNELVKSPDGLDRIWLTSEPVDYWPVTNTSFWIEWRLWGENPLPYWVTNLGLHIINSLLVWLVLRKLSIPGAMLAALLFAVHPVNVESVAWIAQRKNLLAMMFYLLTIWSWLQSHSKKKSTAIIWYAASVMAFFAAMLSKGSVATLPLVLLLVAWWQRQDLGWKTWIRLSPYFGIAVALTLVNLWFRSHGVASSIRQDELVQRTLGASAAIWFYLEKTIIPWNLSFVYPKWHVQIDQPAWWLALVGVGGITLVLFWQRRTRYGRPLWFAWCFFGLAIAPALGFVDVGFMRYSLVADHYQHIAMIGVLALVAAGIARVSLQLRENPQAAAVSPLTVNALMAGCVLALALLTLRRACLVCDPETLYTMTLEANPESSLCHYNLGTLLLDRGENSAAQEHFQAALALDPEHPKAHNSLGITYFNDHNLDAAMAEYRAALDLRPNYPEAHYNLAVALADAGRTSEAIVEDEQALRLKSNLFQVRAHLAAIHAEGGNYRDAVAEEELALEEARAAGKSVFVPIIEKRLESYRAKLAVGPTAPEPAANSSSR